MKSKIDNGFGKIEIEKMTVQRKGSLHLPETGGMRAVRVGKVLQEPYAGELVVYRTHTEIRGEYKGQQFTFIPVDAVLGLVELEPDEEAVPLFKVDENFGNTDAEWINATSAA